MPYSLKFTDAGKADVVSLPQASKNSLRKELLSRLAVNPYGCSVALREPLKGYRSFRWRDYRVVFMVFEDLQAVAIAGIGKRLSQSKQDVYRRLEALAREGKLAEKILVTLRGFTFPGETS